MIGARGKTSTFDIVQNKHKHFGSNRLKISFLLKDIRISQETHYVYATKSNRLMPFRETNDAKRENHTEQTNISCGQNAVYINSVRTSQETYYVSATKPNRQNSRC
jgi:hypothetical protein